LLAQLGHGASVGGVWSRPDAFECIDVLFVDEAAQMSLADVLAVSQAAKTVVLIGDPQQLEQPTQGSHQGADKRTRLVALTKKGHQLVQHAEPKWQKAQQTLMEAIGNQTWAAMRDMLRDTTRLVRHKIADDLAETS
jgi:hypothetical protein